MDAAGIGSPALEDLLRPGLDLVFVGINPSRYSAQRGQYFARPGNRFWPCISRSDLTRDIRARLGVVELDARHGRALLDAGIGFTDVVKRATARAAEVTPAEFAAGVDVLIAKIARDRPRVACFHGVTGYRHVDRLLSGGTRAIALGPQATRIAATRIYVVPNPSGANAHATRAEQTAWYDRLAAFCRAEAHAPA